MVEGSVSSSGTKAGYHKVVIVSVGAIELRVRLGGRMLRMQTLEGPLTGECQRRNQGEKEHR